MLPVAYKKPQIQRLHRSKTSLIIRRPPGRGGGGWEEREEGREGFLGDHMVTWFSGVNGRGISLSTPT